MEHIQEEPQIPALPPRERPAHIHHGVGTSDDAILHLLPTAASHEQLHEELSRDPHETSLKVRTLVPEPITETVVQEETVVSTSVPDKPVVKPRLAKKVSIPSTQIVSTAEAVVVQVEEVPRLRSGNDVVHRGHFSDADVEVGVERHRAMAVKMEAEPTVERESETVVVTEVAPLPLETAEVKVRLLSLRSID